MPLLRAEPIASDEPELTGSAVRILFFFIVNSDTVLVMRPPGDEYFAPTSYDFDVSGSKGVPAALTPLLGRKPDPKAA